MLAPGENAFNPAVSLILGGSYTRLSRDPESHRITGFMPSLGEVGPLAQLFGREAPPAAPTI